VNLPQILGYPLLLVAGLEFLLGILLLRQNPHNSPVNKATAASAFAAAIWSFSAAFMYIRSAMGLDYIFFARLSWIGWFSIPTALQSVLFLKDERSRRARIAGMVLYPFWTTVLALCLFTDLIVTDGYVPFPYRNSPGPLEAPMRLIGGLLVFWLAYEIVRLRGQLTGYRRSQLSWYLYGTIIFGAGGAVVGGFMQLFTGTGLEPSLSAYFSLPWVLMIFYAITRYRLFDVRIVISNTVSALLLFALFAWAHVVLFRLLEPLAGGMFAIPLSLSVMVLLFFATPFSRMVRNLVQRSVLQDKYLYQEVLRESINAIVTILDFGELLDYIADTIRKALRAECVSLYLKGPDDRFALRHGVGGIAQALQGHSLDPAMIDLVQQAGTAVVREELERILSEKDFGDLNRTLKEACAELVIPLRYKGQLAGVLTVGSKGNGEPYVQSDIDLLEALAGHAAVAIENARLYDEAKRAQEALRESEARLATMAEQSIEKYLSR